MLVVSSTAGAEPLAWQAPDNCPTPAAVEAKIATRLGAPLSRVHPQVAVTVTRQGDGFLAHIELASPGDHQVRTLTAASCDELADAVAMIVARLDHAHSEPTVAAPAVAAPAVAAIDEPAAPEADSEIPPGMDAAHPAPPPPPTHELEEPAPAKPRRWTFGARVDRVDMVGTLPRPSLGVDVAACAGWGAARFELSYSAWTSSRGPIDTPSLLHADGIEVDLGTTAARLGVALPETPIALYATFELGSMRGRGVGAFQGASGPDRWSAAGGGISFAIRLFHGVSFVASGDALVAIDRPVFTMTDGTPVWEPQPTSIRVAAGVQIGLP